ncbi:MAG TPA: dNTP triphosphohydrolase [Propionibacteriaceae bacterium]|nr:dNTP triphosphohydrolase [Propionibacteriaceae bacterium]
MHPRLRRARPEVAASHIGAESAVRSDLERIRFSPSFSRLAEVTQVVTAGATGSMTHNRLTHTIKVTAVAREIAVQLLRREDPELLNHLGGLDPVVVQAAAVAHDLGHPPFGHLGERVLDRLARERFGLPDGFEGNAQTFRILTELEVHGPGDEGLNLTAAVRAGVCKYPWGRFWSPDPHPTGWPVSPRGASFGTDGPGAAKFSAYSVDLSEMFDALSAFPEVPAGRQTLECSVMDTADDIAYSLHDVEDFHRSGVLQFSPVSAEFRAWAADRRQFASHRHGELTSLGRTPGAGLERLRRRLLAKDAWMFDEEIFADAVLTVGDEFVDGVLAVPYDGSMSSDRAISAFASRWIAHLTGSVHLNPEPVVRSSYVALSADAWHEVSVLKFVHAYFILDRPDLAMFQRGQAQTVEHLVAGFDAWLSDRLDASRAPRRLLDLVRAATYGYERVANDNPEWLEARTGEADLVRMGRGRGIVDFVSGLTDEQAVSFAARLGGASGLLWSTGAL